MQWNRLVLAAAVAIAATFGFYPAMRLGRSWRTCAWLVCSAVVALSPAIVPLDFTSLRFVASLLAITLLVKLFDMHQAAQSERLPDFSSYAGYVSDIFWLVFRERPNRRSVGHDVWRLLRTGPAAAFAILLCVVLFRLDWARIPFTVEHCAKAPAVVLAVALTLNAIAVVYRLLGGMAMDPMGDPLAARTPADFWRRWNRPTHQFLQAYAFNPAGGRRHAIRATLVTYAVSGIVHEYVFGIAAGRIQGCQMLFFILQGCAVAATLNLRPRGRRAIFWIAATWVFELATSILFFASVNQVLPFYSERIP